MTERAASHGNSALDAGAVKDYLSELQDRIRSSVEALDGGRFRSEAWSRAEGGGGQTQVLTDGAVFERAGVSTSHVFGAQLPASASNARPSLVGAPFEAMGLSLVFHPRNPYVPTTHCNVRFIQAMPQGAPAVWWFGGGFDLTPYYPFDADVLHWHRAARDACGMLGEGAYEKFKDWCDRYFWLPHREETRGVGGLFFDDFHQDGFAHSFDFLRSVGDHFLPAFMPIIERRKDHAYGERERSFQLYRRGRYVEFNLAHDRGTLFGLQSRGRTESILMSLPPLARWEYDWRPEPGSAEARLYQDFLRPRNFLAELAQD